VTIGTLPARTERGSGILSMSLGLLVFFALLVFTIQVMYNLYATSVITSLALDAARDVAERDGLSVAEAEAEFRDHVSGEVAFDIVVIGDTVQASVQWETRSLFPSINDARAFGVLDRTFEVRVEEQQE
jgi:Flp pilus assembly protein TadG